MKPNKDNYGTVKKASSATTKGSYDMYTKYDKSGHKALDKGSSTGYDKGFKDVSDYPKDWNGS